MCSKANRLFDCFINTSQHYQEMYIFQGHVVSIPKHYVIKLCRCSGGKAVCGFLPFDVIWRLVVSFMLRPVYIRRGDLLTHWTG